MDRGRIRPGEPEEADGQTNTAKESWGKTGFGGSTEARSLAFCFRGNTRIAFVVGDSVDDGQHHADSDADEGQAADTLAPATILLEDDGEGGEQHI